MIHPTYHMLAPVYPIHTLPVVGGITPRIPPPPNNMQVGGHYVDTSTGQYDPALSKITIISRYSFIRLRTLLRRFPCGCKLHIIIYIFLLLRKLERKTGQKKHPITPDKVILQDETYRKK